MNKQYEHIEFTLNHTGESKRRTKIWNCHSINGGTHLGVVKWWSHWRRYCFFPESRTIYDANCLWDIADHCALMTKEQKESRHHES